MNLSEKIENLQSLLVKNPALENRAALKAKAKALHKALDDFIKLSEPEMLRDTREFAELSALVALPANKTTATKEWFAAQAKSIGSKAASFTAKKAKDDLILELVKHKAAAAAIAELKTTPAERDKKLLQELVVMNADAADKAIAKIKNPDLEKFCSHNEIIVAKNKKGGFDKKATLANLAAKLDERREYLKI